MLPSPTDVIERWNEARKEIHAECAGNEKRLVLAELMGLRSIAQQALAARLEIAAKRSAKPRRMFTR